MSNNNIVKGVFLVALGATSYGMLATFVKLAYQEDFTTAEVTSAQFIYGIIGVVIINLYQRIKNKNKAIKASSKNILHLDIKPENIMINGNDVFLVDFGFCDQFIDTDGFHIDQDTISD